MATRVKFSRMPVYLGAIAIALLVGGFGMIADEMVEGDTLAFDRAILLLFRSPGNPADPLGPPWLEEAMRDITSLGSFPILIILVTLTVLYLLMSGMRRTGWFLAAAVVGGAIVSTVLKELFNRTRPDITDVTRVFTASFPSGHATTSAVVYLTIGALLAGATDLRRLKVLYLGGAIFLTVVIGITRLYLGVHYPTDVLAGWAIGTAWALLCWAAYHLWLRPAPEDVEPAPDPRYGAVTNAGAGTDSGAGGLAQNRAEVHEWPKSRAPIP
jgi:undecaprenyl-diphosphatase